MKVLGIYKIEEKDIVSFSQEEKDGTTDIKNEKVVNNLIKDKIDFSNQIDSLSRQSVKMKEEAMLSIGDYILIHALVIPGSEQHPSTMAIRSIRDDNDENKLFEELGKLSAKEIDNPKVWAKLNKQVIEIKKQLAAESPEIQLNVIKARVKELRDALLSQKTSTASLSIRAEKDPLSKYKSKRDFDETSEPEGEISSGNKHRFVIQKHQATNLHFDLRLENDDGVLQSWAIPKHKMPEGKEKLLAVETEPHPVSYAKFKGEIEEGYGKGHVDIWASGKYTPIEIKRDKIVFEINSGKASGRYVLYRTSGKKWLLMVSKSDNNN
jgi:DNA ligase D-like protein (predicted 3'-phosphoesterase)